ncbi:DUF882 domain-containing protein [Acetobacteraceae bacterium H6797]|nr:DUF882 domain-containing protein [Acetobacteraceae bacterium H6797]
MRFNGRLPHAPLCPCCEQERQAEPLLSRRSALRGALGLGLACAAVTPVFAQDGAPRRLRAERVGTEDSFDGIYWRDGAYDRDALRQLDWVFRDLSRAEVTPMDPRLFDVLHTVAQRLESTESYQVISGYRSPETNAANAARSRRVSTVSLHMSGMACDSRLPGRDAYGFARQAAQMQLGGVGLYRRDSFVHLDCGPVRRW